MLSPTINHNYAVKDSRERVDPGTPASIRPRLIVKGDNKSGPSNTSRCSDFLSAVGDIREPYKRIRSGFDRDVTEMVTIPRRGRDNASQSSANGLPKTWPQWELSRSRSLSRMKTKTRTQDAGMDFSSVLFNPLESPVADEIPGCTQTPPQSPIDGQRPRRKPILRTTKSSHTLKLQSSRSPEQSSQAGRITDSQHRAQFPPRSSSFEHRRAQPCRSLSRSRSQTIPQRRKQDVSYSIMPPSCRVSAEHKRPSLADVPSLSFGSDMTISNASSAQCSPLEANSYEDWSVLISDHGLQSPTIDSSSQEYSCIIRKQNQTCSLVTIPIMLDDPSYAQNNIAANGCEYEGQSSSTLPTGESGRSRSTFEQKGARTRSRSVARSPPSQIDKPLPCLPAISVQTKTQHVSILHSSCQDHPPVPAIPANLAPMARRKIKSSSNVEQEAQSILQHKHSTSTPDCFGSHFDWEEPARSLAPRKASERKTNFGQSCKHFLHKLSSSSIVSRET